MKKIALPFLSFFISASVYAQITSAGDGNWNNPATWAGGVVPTANDQVVIAPSHDIVLNANGAARTLMIETGGTTATNGTLTIGTAGTTLTIGDYDTGGGKDSVVIYGGLTISNGSLNIGGRLRVYGSPSQYSQTGGIVRIDGNTGSAATSVANAEYLLRSERSSSVAGWTFSGGTILFVDPPLGASGNLMTWNTGFMYLGANSHVQFGDGVSTTAGGNTQGFILTFEGAYVCGNVTINNPAGTNRIVSNLGCDQMSALNLLAGTLNNARSVNILGATTNNGTITQTNDIDFRGGLINNGSITASRNFYTLGDVINNAGASITAQNVNFTKDVVNNGTIAASSTLGFARDVNNSSSTAQVVSGSGTFNTSTATLLLRNTNAAGVTLNQSISVKQLNLLTGKIFLGASDVTLNTVTPGTTMGSSGAYFVTDGTGRLRFTNLSTTQVLFPVGTSSSYNPVRITNGSGHTFAVGVKEGFTVPPPGTQHVQQEWDIDDLTGGAVNATVTLQWNATDEDPTFNRNACVIAHYDGTEWKKIGSPEAASGTNPYTRTATGVSTFSLFTVTSNMVVLPVTLNRFGAAKEGESIKLTWQASTDGKTAYYEVERSPDGVQYTTVARVNARNASGTHNYESYDKTPFKGLNYYRLKMVETTGEIWYSHVSRLDWRSRAMLLISPNPASGEMLLQWDKIPSAIAILDMSGRTVLQFSPAADNRYSLHTLKAGTYFVRVIAGEEVETVKLLVR